VDSPKDYEDHSEDRKQPGDWDSYVKHISPEHNISDNSN
jgi:hypothetical protein